VTSAGEIGHGVRRIIPIVGVIDMHQVL